MNNPNYQRQTHCDMTVPFARAVVQRPPTCVLVELDVLRDVQRPSKPAPSYCLYLQQQTLDPSPSQPSDQDSACEQRMSRATCQKSSLGMQGRSRLSDITGELSRANVMWRECWSTFTIVRSGTKIVCASHMCSREAAARLDWTVGGFGGDERVALAAFAEEQGGKVPLLRTSPCCHP